MATVSKQLQGSSQAPTLKLTVTAGTYDVENNRTPVSYSFQIERPSNVNSTAAKSYTLSIGGQVITGKSVIGGSGTKTLASGTVWIKHNQDGTKTINYGFSMDVEITWSGVYNGTVSASSNYELPTIPRATTPVLNKSEIFTGETLTITMQRASSTFTHNLKLQIGSTVIQIGTGYGVSAQYTLPDSLNNYITESTSYEAKIWCETYQGSTHIGSQDADLLVKVPTSVAPTINSVNVAEKNTAVTIGEYVQGFSKLTVNVNASGVYGSSIKLITAELDGVSYQGTPFDTETLFYSGSKNLTVKVKDSRGRTTTTAKAINVLEYYEPKINDFKAERCDSDGTLNPSGTCAKITYNYAIAPLNNKNAKSIKFEYLNGESYSLISELSTYTGNSSFITSSLFSIDNSYDIRMSIKDTFSETVYSYAKLETDQTTFDIHSSGQGMAFGKVAEQADLFDVDWLAKFRKGIDTEADILPTLLNGWSNFNPETYKEASYFKDSFGVVHLAGMISGGTTTAGTGLFTLPEGYRPSKTEIFLCLTSSGYDSIRVDKNGAVILHSGADSTWTALSGIAFKGV